MGTTTDKLNRLINTKEGLRQEINRAYGIEVIGTSDTFSGYIQKLKDAPFHLTGYIERLIGSIDLPEVTSIGNYAFYSCSKLTSVEFPNATSIGDYAFHSCSKLTSVEFPNATSVGSNAFRNCSDLTSISLPKATSIGTYAIAWCRNLTTIYVGTETSTVCTLSSTNAFSSCTSLTNIYVPASLVGSYKSATNWSNYANKIKAAP